MCKTEQEKKETQQETYKNMLTTKYTKHLNTLQLAKDYTISKVL